MNSFSVVYIISSPTLSFLSLFRSFTRVSFFLFFFLFLFLISAAFALYSVFIFYFQQMLQCQVELHMHTQTHKEKSKLATIYIILLQLFYSVRNEIAVHNTALKGSSNIALLWGYYYLFTNWHWEGQTHREKYHEK